MLEPRGSLRNCSCGIGAASQLVMHLVLEVGAGLMDRWIARESPDGQTPHDDIHSRIGRPTIAVQDPLEPGARSGMALSARRASWRKLLRIWWRRGESNPRPRKPALKSLRAYPRQLFRLPPKTRRKSKQPSPIDLSKRAPYLRRPPIPN